MAGFKSPMPPRSPMKERHLQAVPDGMRFRGLDRFTRTLNRVHLASGTVRAERQVGHLLREARESGHREAADRLALALDVLRDAREALK